MNVQVPLVRMVVSVLMVSMDTPARVLSASPEITVKSVSIPHRDGLGLGLDLSRFFES